METLEGEVDKVGDMNKQLHATVSGIGPNSLVLRSARTLLRILVVRHADAMIGNNYARRVSESRSLDRWPHDMTEPDFAAGASRSW